MNKNFKDAFRLLAAVGSVVLLTFNTSSCNSGGGGADSSTGGGTTKAITGNDTFTTMVEIAKGSRISISALCAGCDSSGGGGGVKIIFPCDCFANQKIKAGTKILIRLLEPEPLAKDSAKAPAK
jgi:hypothetical protein